MLANYFGSLIAPFLKTLFNLFHAEYVIKSVCVQIFLQSIFLTHERMVETFGFV